MSENATLSPSNPLLLPFGGGRERGLPIQRKPPHLSMRRLSLKTAAIYLLRREWELAPLAGAREDIQSSLYGPARPLTRGRADSHIYEESLWS